jgi:hypothetical protein
MGATSQQIVISGTAVSAANQDFTVKSVSASVSIGAVSGAFTGTVTVGALTSTGVVSGSNLQHGVGGGVTSADGTLRLGTGAAAGSVIVRPDGLASSTSQIVITNTAFSAASQDFTVKTVTSGGITNTGAVSFTGGGVTLINNTRTDFFAPYTAGSATRGVSILDGGTSVTYRSNASINTAATHMTFANLTNGQVGSISTNGTATAYNVSSDAVLKNVIGNYDPQAAIAIIRADPVQDFNFKSDGSYAVGWVAQHSYSVSTDLATPGNDKDPTDPDFQPWGVDQSKRTPYLWAALAWALDQIDSLTMRVTTLEGGSAA